VKKQRTAQVAPAQVQQTQTQPQTQAQTQPQTRTPGVTPVKVGARSGAPQSAAAFTQARYPFIASEMKTIGIITAAIIVVLVVLAFVLPPLLP
jgi:hypothetical protein